MADFLGLFRGTERSGGATHLFLHVRETIFVLEQKKAKVWRKS
jgi:hypothetical protein